tara:strand:- start:6887 stop:7516 length:630 start_codon:yes stop_codon:yes gene_type:complete
MLHIICITLLVLIIVISVIKCFILFEEKFINIDEKIISNIKKKKSNILNFLLGNDEKIDNGKTMKLKRINHAIRFDLVLSTLIGILWFIYPFMLIQKNRIEIMDKSPDDRYIGRWIALILLFSNIYSFRYLNNGEIFSKQYILFIKLLCAILIIITSTIITCLIKKLYFSNIINILLVSIWFSNSLIGLFFSYKDNKELDKDSNKYSDK